MYKKVLLSVLCCFMIFNSVSFKAFATDQATNDLDLKPYGELVDNIEPSFNYEYSMTEEEFQNFYSLSTLETGGVSGGIGSEIAGQKRSLVTNILLFNQANYSGPYKPTLTFTQKFFNSLLNNLDYIFESNDSYYTYLFLVNNTEKLFINDSSKILFNDNSYYYFVDENNTLLTGGSLKEVISSDINVPKNAFAMYIRINDRTIENSVDKIDIKFYRQVYSKVNYVFNADLSNLKVYSNMTTSSGINVDSTCKYFCFDLQFTPIFYNKSSLGLQFLFKFDYSKYGLNAPYSSSNFYNDRNIVCVQIPKNCNFIVFENNRSYWYSVFFDADSQTFSERNHDSTKYGQGFMYMNFYVYPAFKTSFSSRYNGYDNKFCYTSNSDDIVYYHDIFYDYKSISNDYMNDNVLPIYYSAYDTFVAPSQGSNNSGGSSSGGSNGGSTIVSSDLMDILKDIRDNVVNCYGTLDKIRNTYIANSKDLFDILKEMNNKLNNLGSGSTDLTNTNNLINQVLTKLDSLNTSIKSINVSVPSVDLSKIYERLDTLISKVQSLDDNNRADFKSLLKALEDLEINNNISNVTNKDGKNIWDFLTELVKGLSDVLTHLTDGLSDISTKLLDLVEKFMDMLISLIVPDDSFFNDYFQSIHDDFSSRTGLFTSSLNVATNVVDQFQQVNQSGEYVLTIPNIDLLGVRFINEQSYDVQEVFSNGEMSKLYNYYMIVIKGIFSLLFLNYLRKKFEHGILGGVNA